MKTTRRSSGVSGNVLAASFVAFSAAAALIPAAPAPAQDQPFLQMQGGMMNSSAAGEYRMRWVSRNLDEREVKRLRTLGYTDETIKGAANIALGSGRSLDYVLRRVTVTGLPLARLAAMLGVPAGAVIADIPGYGVSAAEMSAMMGAMMTKPRAGMGGMNGGTSGMMMNRPLTEADLRLDLAQPVTNTTGPTTPPPDELRTVTPEEKAAADRGAQETIRRADPQMRAVLEAFQAFGAPPLFTLTPEEARRQPSIADAVKAVLRQQNKPTDPEPVGGGVRDTTIPGPAGPVPVRVYTPSGSGPFPVIVYFHGGGFVIATIDTYDASARALANAARAVVVSVEYRKAPEAKLPAAHEDSYAVTQYVMNNAASMNGDPNRVAVAGESAGGNLAADMCLLARARGGKMPVHQLLVYPVADNRTDLPSDRENMNAIPLNVPVLRWFFNYILPNPQFANSPLVNIVGAPLDRGLPPATIITAELDPLRSEGQALAERLRQGGVSVRVQNFNGVAHEFFGMGAVVDKAKQAVQFAADGLRASFEQRR